ncbi:hypothetical protein [Streptomyces sp. HUAS TT20]|uniref:hypothetical protein n=1 Tax=Streptomyces sp. HUAS TT20 TaxID=3447509 RepID=UPI0021DA973C|nr:hypothetical protein [Streptomyces sp. HUAS 15-9]UXY32063.1 hypothetical protein N8I87_39610 [Streptomyces sp. HUAS 15-9]
MTLTASDWRLIDRRILADLDPSSLHGRAQVQQGAERTRLEADLTTIRTWSLSMGAAAITLGGLGVVVDPQTRFTATGLVIAGVVALIGLVNSIPLRQSPHPPQKVPQLRGRMTWRHRLLLLAAAGFAAEIVVTVVVRLV